MGVFECVYVCLCDSYDYGSLGVICLCVDEEPDPLRMWLFVANRMNDSYGLGTMLGLNSVQLSNIEGQHPEMVRRCMEVLNTCTWIKQGTRTPVTWRTLITALREMKRN